jgi:hypothetical protein
MAKESLSVVEFTQTAWESKLGAQKKAVLPHFDGAGGGAILETQ